jgi:hypothetical protein
MTQAAFFEQTPKSFVQKLFEESSTQKQHIGCTIRLADGREYVYGQAGAANIAVGKLCQGAVHDVANHGNIALTNANANDQSVTVTLGNLLIAANAYAEGYLNVCDGTGEGYLYKIKSHPAAAANAALVIKLYDKILLTTSSAHCTLVRHPAKGIIIHPSPATQALVGVTVIPVTANYYAWWQKKGPCCVLVDGVIVAGGQVFVGSVDGSVAPSSGNAIDDIKLQTIGRVLTVDANTMHGVIDLQLP